MKREIISKFSPEDEVYYIDQISIPSYHKCSLCLGDGNVYHKCLIEPENSIGFSAVMCPKCEGKKEITTSGSIKDIIKRDVIKRIFITLDDCTTFGYNLKDKGIFHGEVYETLTEASENLPKGRITGYTT